MHGIVFRSAHGVLMLAVVVALAMATCDGRAADAVSNGPAALAAVTNGPAQTADSGERILRGVPFGERLKQGGWTMVFLLFVSVVAVSCALERAVHLKRSVIYPAGLAEQAKVLWRAARYDDIYTLCDKHPSTLAAIISAFVRHRTCLSSELSILAGDIASRDMRAHLQRAYPMAIAATVAPLLGLFGTVIGMIEAFEIVAIAGSLGDASLLAGSISKALVTTAAGLVIAIPALAAYHYFKSRTNTLVMGLEGDVNELLTTWFMDRADEAGSQGGCA